MIFLHLMPWNEASQCFSAALGRDATVLDIAALEQLLFDVVVVKRNVFCDDHFPIARAFFSFGTSCDLCSQAADIISIMLLCQHRHAQSVPELDSGLYAVDGSAVCPCFFALGDYYAHIARFYVELIVLGDQQFEPGRSQFHDVRVAWAGVAQRME